MNRILVASLSALLLALSFTTGFTCSKNAPEQSAAPAAVEQTEMAAPVEAPPTPPAPSEQSEAVAPATK